MKTVNIKGTDVPEERAAYALIFLEEMEKKVGTDFIRTLTTQKVEV